MFLPPPYFHSLFFAFFSCSLIHYLVLRYFLLLSLIISFPCFPCSLLPCFFSFSFSLSYFFLTKSSPSSLLFFLLIPPSIPYSFLLVLSPTSSSFPPPLHSPWFLLSSIPYSFLFSGFFPHFIPPSTLPSPFLFFLSFLPFLSLVIYSIVSFLFLVLHSL